MWSSFPLLFALWASFATPSAISQGDCLVKLPELFGSYEGDCKRGKADGTGTANGTDQYTGEWRKGYPHGEGVYTHANGNVYTGDFKNGEREGKGTLTHGDSTIQDGYWAGNLYMGTEKNPYDWLRPPNSMAGINVRKVNHTGNRMMVSPTLNGSPMATRDVYFHATTGSPFNTGTQFGFNDLQYPVDITVRYQITHQAIMEFTMRVNHPGEYAIEIRQ